MASRIFSFMKTSAQRRVWWLAGLLICAFGGLSYRLVDLQVFRHEELRQLAQRNTQRGFVREPRRGDILDIRGNLLASSIPVKNICADPVLIRDQQAAVARVLSPLLQIPENDLRQRLQITVRVTDTGETITNQYVVLKRKVSLDLWDEIKDHMTDLNIFPEGAKLTSRERIFLHGLRQRAIFAEDDQLRVYPGGSLAAHVLGYVGVTESEINNTRVIDTAGKDGIEYTFNSKLCGVRGWRRTEKDSRQREIVAFREQDIEPRPGMNVVLTLDSVLQNIVETELLEGFKKHAPVSASAVVVRPRTGEILAMATLPTYDPNDVGEYPPAYRRNRVITDVFEPGSTFKIVVVSGALNDHLVRLSDTFDCEGGRFYYGGQPLRDHDAYGWMTVANIIAKSSNIGSAKIAIKMGKERFYDYILKYGFQAPTGIPLLGEVNGILAPPNKWYPIRLSRVPIGQGVAVTEIQLVMAMSVIANHGVLMRPMLVDRVVEQDGTSFAQYHPQVVRRVVSEETARQMVSALKRVVSTNGTAPRAMLKNYHVAGKTGTGEVPGRGTYLPGKYVGSFVGFFPADRPELCIAVVFNQPSKEGYYGGTVAAPVFKRIAERAANYLNIEPDLMEPLEETQNQDTRPIRTAAAHSWSDF